MVDEKSLDMELSLALQKAIRRPKPGQMEQLIANELAIAVFNIDPLQKIRHILEAYMVLPEEERAKTFTAEENEKAMKIYSVCISLLNIVEYPIGNFEQAQAVPFGFGEDEAEAYLQNICRNSKTAYETLSSDAHPISVREFKVRFINAAMPFALQVARRIVEQYISRETWMQAMRMQRRVEA
ncbi:MAG: hypothetical protein QXK78_01630 [Candidatus Bathyarchaeia archaeon]